MPARSSEAASPGPLHDHRAGPGGAPRGLPGGHHPQDPVSSRTRVWSSPSALASGYRKFSDADVERLRHVLRMQRDHYLPLRVIGEQLDAMDAGLDPVVPETAVPSVPVVALSEDGMPSPSRSRAPTACGCRDASCSRSPRSTRCCWPISSSTASSRPLTGSALYDTDAVLVARTARDLAEFRPRAPPPARVPHGRGPRGRPGREQVLAPLRAGRDAGARARTRRPWARSPRSRCGSTRTLVKAGCAGPRPHRPGVGSGHA